MENVTIASRTLSRPLPPWVIFGGSGLIVFHFAALIILVLAAPSGPWPSNFGASPAPPPPFAAAVNRGTSQIYLRPLHLENDYHFVSNVPDRPSVFFEVRLKDQKGGVIQILKFPDEKANSFVRHRQRLMAEWLGNDMPVQPPPGEQVLPAGKNYPTVTVWLSSPGDPVQKLMKISELQLPKDRPLSRPSEISLLLAESYARYLCREYGAASAEVIRHSRNAIAPGILFEAGPNGSLPREAFLEQACNFGEFRS